MSSHVLGYFQEWGLHQLPGQPLLVHGNPFCKEILPDVQPELPEAMSSCPCTWVVDETAAGDGGAGDMSVGIVTFSSCLSPEGLCAGYSPYQWLQTKKEFQCWTWSEHCLKNTFAFQKMKQRRGPSDQSCM